MIANIIRASVCLAGVSTIAGCSINPRFDVPYDAAGAPTVTDIVDRIYCELMDTANTNYDDFGNSILNDDVIATLTLTVQGKDGVSSAETAGPLSTLTLAVTGNLSRQRTNVFGEVLQYSMAQLSQDAKDGKSTIDCNTKSSSIADDLDIEQTVAAAYGSVSQKIIGFSMPPVDKTASGGVFSSKTIFVVTRSLDPLKASFVLSAISVPNTLTFSSVYTDEIDLAFAPHVKPTGPKAMPVYIVPNPNNKTTKAVGPQIKGTAKSAQPLNTDALDEIYRLNQFTQTPADK